MAQRVGGSNRRRHPAGTSWIFISCKAQQSFYNLGISTRAAHLSQIVYAFAHFFISEICLRNSPEAARSSFFRKPKEREEAWIGSHCLTQPWKPTLWGILETSPEALQSFCVYLPISFSPFSLPLMDFYIQMQKIFMCTRDPFMYWFRRACHDAEKCNFFMKRCLQIQSLYHEKHTHHKRPIFHIWRQNPFEKASCP